MTLRITQDGLLRSVVDGLRGRAERMSKLYDEFATQRRINVPSDDPAGSGVVLRLQAQLSALQQTQASANSAKTLMDSAMGYLSQIVDNVTEVEAVAVRANGAMGADQRGTLAQQVNEYLEDLVATTNSRLGDRYLFSGTATEKAAVTVTRNADGEIETVSYNGAATALEVPLQGDRTIVASVTAKDALVDTGLFAGLIALRNHLRNRDGLDTASLNSALADAQDQIKRAHQSLLNETGKLGARQAQLEVTSLQLTDNVTRAQDMMSRARDADIAEVAVELQKETTLYQALLGASNKIMSRSLLDYLQ